MIHVIYIYLIIGGILAGYQLGDPFNEDKWKVLLVFVLWLPYEVWLLSRPIRKYIDGVTEISTWVSLMTGSYKHVDMTMENAKKFHEQYLSMHKSRYRKFIAKVYFGKLFAHLNNP